ncbi:hemocyanin A chain-like [Procambarus clarkii]|uniref:hemocyanin A chain-like n=1 Tax=Procambarus clarkii TaxID=6728 RepID=UPI001E671D86|nr:hemocyanin A chain-like [Procambarus clarkii]
MQWTVLVAALLVAIVSADTDVAHQQQAINRLLYKVTSHIQSGFTDLKEAAETWNPRDHTDRSTDGGAAIKHLTDELDENRLLEQHHWFSLFNDRQREEALLLVDVLLHSADFEAFKNNAAYFREHVNEGEFVYALYVAVTHSELTPHVVLPPLYEVTPHLFTNSEVIDKAYTAKMTQTPGNFKMEFTGSKKNREQRVAYFGEDVGLNSHHVHWHMDFPFWWDGAKIDRKGELFFWAHHQLTARYDAERLSNFLPTVDELYWDHPIRDGFAPHTTYKYGGEFPARPDNKEFEDVVGVARIRDLKELESRIRDAISHGYIINADGTKTDINNEHGIDILGDIIESSTYTTNAAYYGALHNQAHRILGAQSDPKRKFNMPPGVMEHFETATRDPAFFRLHKYMDNIFKEHKDSLPPYTAEDLLYSNVKITGVEVSELSTFFEDFEFDLSNALDSTENVNEVSVKTHISRLNHKPFSLNIHAQAEHDDKVTVRVYISPKQDENHITLDIDESRWGAILLDTFWTEVHAGDNEIKRKSSESSVAIPDRVSFPQLIHDADEAVANGAELPHKESRSCGHPQRLLLPKGREQGMDFWLDVIITSGDDGVQDDLTVNDHGSTHSYCGIHGQKYPDKRPMGFPFDRPIPDLRVFKVQNQHGQVVKIFHH